MTMPLHRKEARQHEKARRPLSIESPVPLTQRGPMLFVDDIQHLYGKKPDGKWRRSTKWIHARRKDQGAVAQSIADALTKPITPKTPKRKHA